MGVPSLTRLLRVQVLQEGQVLPSPGGGKRMPSRLVRRWRNQIGVLGPFLKLGL